MPLTRRDLLARGALFLAAGLTTPAFVARTALALDPTSGSQVDGSTQPWSKRVLVVVQLSGGNDGLNTLAPFGDPAYALLRPRLALAPQEVLPLIDQVGLHPGLGKLKSLYDQGRVAVVQGVGYPNPNRSHFRGMEIWHTARPETFERSGWLGRYVDACQCQQEGTLPAISVGEALNGAFWTQTTLVPAIARIGAFSFQTDSRFRNDRPAQLQALENIYAQAGTWSASEDLVRRATLSALAGSEQVQRIAESYATPIVYPANNSLATQLKMVAQIVAGDIGTRLFSVQLGGFDTHANQKDRHATLMRQLAEALDAFLADLQRIGRQDDVALLVFSEFGRRARENGSAGTDHGTAEPVFVVGNPVRGGLYGRFPSLSDLDANGDVRFTADFRSIYAGVLRHHLGVDPARVLDGAFEAAALFRSAV